MWQQEPSGYSPCVEIDSSSVRCKDRLASPSWLKQEHDELRIIKWENFQSGAAADAVQDNTPSSAMSGGLTVVWDHWHYDIRYTVGKVKLKGAAENISSKLSLQKPLNFGAQFDIKNNYGALTDFKL